MLLVIVNGTERCSTTPPAETERFIGYQASLKAKVKKGLTLWKCSVTQRRPQPYKSTVLVYCGFPQKIGVAYFSIPPVEWGDQCCPLGHRCCIKTVSTAPGARRIKDCNKAFRKQTATSSCAVQRLRVNYVLSTTPTELQFHERSESLKPVCVVTGL